jgi:hypothetical protein
VERRPLTPLPLGWGIGVGEIGGLRLCSSISSVLSRRRFAHDGRSRLFALSTTRCRFMSPGGLGHLFLHARGRTVAAPTSGRWARHPRGPTTCAVRHRPKFFRRRRRMDSAPSPNRPEPTHNRRRPRTIGMGCEVEGRACSRGRAVVNTTPHGSPSRADPGLVGRGRAKLPRSRRGIFLRMATPADPTIRCAASAVEPCPQIPSSPGKARRGSSTIAEDAE